VEFAIIPAIQIKRSGGMVRGKSDRIDSKRIAEYAAIHSNSIKPTIVTSKEIQELRYLMSLRRSYVSMVAEIKGRLPQRKVYDGLKNSNFIIKTERKTLRYLEKQVEEVDNKIAGLVKSDPVLNKNFELIKSLTGVGDVIAIAMIATTNNFQNFIDPRKFACHVGVAPFPYSSGTSIRGKTRTSKMANRQIKAILHMGAFCAIRCDKELKAYYQRKVAEGKNKMAVLNAICFKLIARIFAVVKRQTPYIPMT
jgi:transposase